MQFKRNEGFRFAFGEPLVAEYVILIDGKPTTLEQQRFTCEVLDISPRGMKIMTGIDFKQFSGQHVLLEVHFKLDQIQLKAIAEIVWTKSFGKNYQYGLTFNQQAGLEELIVSELKVRRKREVSGVKMEKL